MGHSFSNRIPPRLRLIALTLAWVLLLPVAGIVGWKTYDDRRLVNSYARAQQTQPAAPRLIRDEPDADAARTGRHTVTLRGIDGDDIIFRIAYPLAAQRNASNTSGSSRRFGCVIMNYGIGQNMRFFRRIAPLFAEYDIVFVLPEQYGCGVRKEKSDSLFGKLMAARTRPARLVAETRLIIDYLQTLPQIDPERIDYMGISYGGIVGATLIAEEPRLRTATFIMAGGDLSAILSHITRSIFPRAPYLSALSGHFGGWWLSAFEPLQHIGHAKTSRLLFLQVEPDELIPRATRDALVSAAPQPKEERVYPGPHSAPPVTTIRKMIFNALDWMEHQRVTQTVAPGDVEASPVIPAHNASGSAHEAP